MRRPHRRMHLLLWALLAPATAIAAVIFWLDRPSTPLTDLPASIEALSAERD